MTTINKLKDIIRKLNDVIIYTSKCISMNEYKKITNEIEDIERMINEEVIIFPILRDNTEKLIKDIYENIKEINNDHQPKCGTMEEFLDNEMEKEHAFVCYFNDKKREYQIRKEEISELLELWKYGNISVDEIREKLKEI